MISMQSIAFYYLSIHYTLLSFSINHIFNYNTILSINRIINYHSYLIYLKRNFHINRFYFINILKRIS